MESNDSGLFAQVAVLAQLGRAGGLFTYQVPAELQPVPETGSLVRVPFVNRQFQGVVCSLTDRCELPRVRNIAEVLDPVPVVTSYQLRLAGWIADYYGAPISDVLGAMLPPGLGRQTLYFLEPGAAVTTHRLTADQQVVLEMVNASGRVALSDLERDLPEADVGHAIGSLLTRHLLRRTAELAGPKVRARTQRILSATPAAADALQDVGWQKRSPRRHAVLAEIALRAGEVTATELQRQQSGAAAAIKALAEAGFITVQERESLRSPTTHHRYVITQPMPLSGPQAAAHIAIVRSLESGRRGIFLLHGVTGSGKTEVYLQAVAETIRRGKQAIMMVPEISLTPQAIERVAGRFPGRTAVLHSKLSPGERLDEWQRIRRGEVDVVVGPRSALFAPLPNPGLIVVDEEHDPSYKQDSSPRYHGRDAAAVLGRLAGATIIFGSATPDVGTYYAARVGRITLLELPDRPVWSAPVGARGASEQDALGEGSSRPMPPVEVVDMRHELKAGNRSIFSEPLLSALNQTLLDGHQALLFLNRRGSATVVLCRDCGYVARCPNCDIPFTYHAAVTRLICHRCDKRVPSPRACPGCQSPRIRYLGVGTQRVEEEVARLFPQARVLRWDRDVTGGKGAHARILGSFSRHEADILVGTQMIAKGLDFPLVTLVGVISADTGLHMPDFRAPERSFQLLTQVAGRAGRASLPSRVVVQTYTPDHYAVQAAQDHDYHRFYREEMSFRLAACYPPFSRLVRFVYSAEDEQRCRQSAANLRAILEKAITERHLPGVELIGPAPCFVARIKNRYFWQLIARITQANGGSGMQNLLDYVPPGWATDVDPVDLL